MTLKARNALIYKALEPGKRTLTANPVLQWRLILIPTVTSMLVIIGMGIVVFLARRE